MLKIIGERVKKIREESNLTQSELAKIIGTSRSVVANIEGNRVEPRDWFIKSLCREFSINENWLLTGTGDIIQTISNDYDLFLQELFSNLQDNTNVTMASVIDKITKLDDEYIPVIEKLIDGLLKGQ